MQRKPCNAFRAGCLPRPLLKGMEEINSEQSLYLAYMLKKWLNKSAPKLFEDVL